MNEHILQPQAIVYEISIHAAASLEDVHSLAFPKRLQRVEELIECAWSAREVPPREPDKVERFLSIL